MIERVKVREIVEIDDVAAWLRTHIPTVEQKPCLIHWDYRLDNVMFRPELPVRVRSVLDWEVATIGDPLIDVGWLLGMWKEPNDTLVAWPGNLPLHTTARRAMTSLLAMSWPTDTPRRRNATSLISPSTRCWDSSSWRR